MPVASESGNSARIVPRKMAAGALTALGIVYGDLGTSPLYTMHTIVETLGVKFTPAAALGILSLIVWALVITISVKYCLFVMRADNQGEGGILALMSLTGANWAGRGRVLIVMGLFGAALIYGDGVITPAISVLSALEGLNVATSVFKPHIVPMAVIVLAGLFAIQGRGTVKIGMISGPVMLLWFVVIAALGLGGIAHHPGVLAAVDPRAGLGFLLRSGWGGFTILGGVFLAITGGEALYADMGSVGCNPIRTTWYSLVLPALLLNYAGQTAFLLAHPGIEGNPFFRLAPAWAIYPLVALASIATIIASQAIITGSFALTRQAMQLGWFPALSIRQTSADEYGQIYVPFVNWTMMLFTIALTIGFGSSVRLAGAYGTAVSTTMVLTTALLYTVMRRRWRWSVPLALLTCGMFLVVDAAFFAANMLKVVEGGWIPLTFGGLLFILMTTWHAGLQAVIDKMATMTEPPEQFLKRLQEGKISRVPGTAVFLTRAIGGTPPLMIEHLSQFGAMHQTLIALTVKFEDIPRVPSEDRCKIVKIGDGYWQVTVCYGFIEVPDLPTVLHEATEITDCVDLDKAIYFASCDEVVRRKRGGKLSWWRLPLFAFLFRNSVRAAERFNLPAANFIEMRRQIEI